MNKPQPELRDLTAREVATRLQQVSHLRDLCLSLAKAGRAARINGGGTSDHPKPVRESSSG